jgi:hypothetical protein
LQEEQAAAVARTRADGDAQIRKAKEALAADVAELKRTLASQSDELANRIADSVLRRSAA